MIGADASIFDFIQQADNHPTNLVISGNRIAGLVSLHDIQQLPVRAALFALITSLEMAMALAIEGTWLHSDDWIQKLSEGRQEKLREQIVSATKNDSFVSAIAFTQFSDKADLIRRSGLLSQSRKSLEISFRNIQGLRDNLAHANSYAATPEDAKKVCEIVLTIYKLKENILSTLGA